MNVVKYEEESSEIDFPTNELLSPYEPPSTSAPAYGLPEPKLNLLDGTFFSYVPEKSSANKIVAICMVCRPRYIEVKGYGNCSSNFLSHLKRRHGEETVSDYRNYIRCKKIRYSKEEEIAKTSIQMGNVRSSEPLSPEMPTMPTSSLPMKGSKDPTMPIINYGEQLDENIYKFFISAMISPDAVENPYFSQLLGMQAPIRGYQMMTQQCLEKRIKDNFNAYVTDNKMKLNELENVGTTIHIWTGEKKNLIGVCAHWITQDLRRYSTPLACRSIKCKNYNSFRVTQLVREIYEDFGIDQNKLVGTVAGNSSAFVWDFQVFGVQLTNILITEHLDLEDCILFDADDVNSCYDAGQKIPRNDVVPIDATTMASPLQCCSDILITAVSNAIHEELNYANNTALSNIHATTINKCNILWQAASNPKLSEIIERHVNIKLKRPMFNDWTSLNRALQQILAIQNKNAVLHQALNLQNSISDAEFAYINEYLISTAPIVEALDILQSNQNTFYGILIPCLFALRRHLLKVSERTEFHYCKSLLSSYMSHVTNAFCEYFDLGSKSQNAAFAALSFPRFKNQWLVCVSPTQRNEILNAFKEAVAMEVNMKILVETQQPAETNNRENDFFNFEADFENENQKANLQRSLDAPYRKAEAQVMQFFAEESTDLSILYSYPEIKRVFLKYNTPLPSLATGERLFNLPTMNELKRNHKYFNDLLEKRLILNAQLHCKQHF